MFINKEALITSWSEQNEWWIRKETQMMHYVPEQILKFVLNFNISNIIKKVWLTTHFFTDGNLVFMYAVYLRNAFCITI